MPHQPEGAGLDVLAEPVKGEVIGPTQLWEPVCACRLMDAPDQPVKRYKAGFMSGEIVSEKSPTSRGCSR